MQKQKEIKSDMQTVYICKSRKKYKEICREYRYVEEERNTKRHVDSIDIQKQKEIQRDMQTVQICRSRKKNKV